MNTLINTLAAQLQIYTAKQFVWIACSGGCDSMVLLDAYRHLFAANRVPTFGVIHINHQLQQQADDWAALVTEYCEKYRIPMQLFRLDAPTNQNIELWARTERYKIFANMVKQEQLLLLAHHMQDNVETFFQHLNRSAGIDGLSAIPKQRSIGQGVLLRPFLNIHKNMIIDYQIEQQVPFVDDPSNLDISYSRNFLRHEVLPILAQRWPKFDEAVNVSMHLLKESNHLLTKYLQPLFVKLFDPKGVALDMNQLNDYDLAEKKWFLRYWLQSCMVQMPNKPQLDEIIRQIALDSNQLRFDLQAKDQTVQLRRYQNKLYLFAGLPQMFQQSQWQIDQALCIYADKVYDADKLFSPKQQSYFKADSVLTMIFNQSGPSIKKFWQTKRVPPWCRSALPLFYLNDHLLNEVDYSLITDDWHLSLPASLLKHN